LLGIFLAPFIHADINHLIENSISLLILGSIFLIMERKLSLVIVMKIIVIGGFGTWLIGRSDCGSGPCTHIGASGVIYGILGYLVSMGIFIRNSKAIIVSSIMFVLFLVKGQALQGIFPTDRFVSWEYHLCGFLSGIITARVYSQRNS
jgi:membrane associated rhomboid family serine protease